MKNLFDFICYSVVIAALISSGVGIIALALIYLLIEGSNSNKDVL